MATATANAAELGPLGLENPMGTDGFEFVEYAAPHPELLRSLFAKMGFPAVARHKRKNVTLHRQATSTSSSMRSPIASPNSSHATMAHALAQWRSASRTRSRPTPGHSASARPTSKAMWPRASSTFPASRGSADRGSISSTATATMARSTTSTSTISPTRPEQEAGHASHLTYLDHLTHNVNRGRMNHWAEFYERLFNFREIRYFDIEGKVTGLFSKAMTSPCGKIRIPLNESQDDKSQIEEFLREYKGEGIQHIALGSADIYNTVDILRDTRHSVPGYARHLL
jgi:4-hydroxyphenylpyruvate dioxygenase